MEMFKERFLTEGEYLGNGILKIYSIINHQVDARRMLDAGAEFAQHFAYLEPTRVLTAEVSGIVPALTTAFALEVPLVFARKHRPITMKEPTLGSVKKQLPAGTTASCRASVSSPLLGGLL